MIKQIKKNIKLIIIVIMISCIFGWGSSYAATTYAINSNKVEYKDNSSLGVTNVQAAIDGTCSRIDEKFNGIYGLKLYTVSSDFTLNSSGYASLTISAARTDGTRPRAIAGVSFNSTYFVPVAFMLNTDNTVTVTVRSTNGATGTTAKVYVRILYY